MSLLALYAAQVTLPSHWAELGQDRSTEYARRRQMVKATKNTREEAKRAPGAVMRAQVAERRKILIDVLKSSSPWGIGRLDAAIKSGLTIGCVQHNLKTLKAAKQVRQDADRRYHWVGGDE